MDRTGIIVLVLCMIAFVGWFMFMNKMYPPRPASSSQTNAVSGTSVITNQTTAATTTTTSPTPAPTPNVEVPLANTNVPEELLVVTNDKARYTFTSHGGGLKLVELLDYPETVATNRAKRTETNRLATLNTPSEPAPTLAILGGGAVQGDGVFTLSTNASGVRAEKR